VLHDGVAVAFELLGPPAPPLNLGQLALCGPPRLARVSVGAVAGSAVSLLLVAIALFLAGLYWLAVRVSKDRATFAEALCNWPVAVLVGLVALGLSVVPW
jgi:uncharacterized membrane protein YfbV (UPF0208 family)